MKVLFYCQHVLGIGHYFRSLEICRALDRDHQVLLAVGGPPADRGDLGGIRLERLPELSMDADFKNFLPSADGTSLDEVKAERKKILAALFKEFDPDVFMVELYPFGRKAFRFELDPILQGIREEPARKCLTVCSLRDILVEKKDQESYESRVVKILNKYFDALLIHSDSSLIDLGRTFSSLDRIEIPIEYTGFVTPRPRPGVRETIRKRLGLESGQKLITAAAGGGAVGFELIQAAVRAFPLLNRAAAGRLQVFAGPYMSESDYQKLEEQASPGTTVERFTRDYISWLAASDLSISLGGYNTTMNILAAGTRALVLPFAQNREQKQRAETMAALGALELLTPDDLEPELLASRIEEALNKTPAPAGINLDGAAHTAKWLEKRMGFVN